MSVTDSAVVSALAEPASPTRPSRDPTGANPPAPDDALRRLLASAAVLVVDDDAGTRQSLKRALGTRCALLELAGSAEEAEALRLRYHFDLLIVATCLPGLSGLQWVRQLRDRGVRTHVIYLTADADLTMAVEALRNGASDFIMKPFRSGQMLLAMQRTLTQGQVVRENSLLRLQLDRLHDDGSVVGQSRAIRDTLELAQRVAPTRSTVLIQGETGTGKELLARALHVMSKRNGAFVAINCGAIAPELFESELFGHVKGAFTGAVQARDGLFAHAERGTLLLDEVGELPAAMQTKLLRVLEERLIRPVGSEREYPVDVRVLAATNCDLSAMAASGEFRQDLYYRLSVLPVDVPPLRDRLEDIPLLVEHFVEQLSAELRIAPIELMHTDWERLRAYPWPGNVRELRNVMERTLLMGRLPADSLRCDGNEAVIPGSGYPLDWPIERVERAHIESVLQSVNNNKSAAARQLGVSRKTLERKQHLWYG